MKTKKLKTYTLDDMKNKYIGERGSTKREAYEYELRMKILEEKIKS